MKKFRSTKGEIRTSSIISLLVLLVLIYEATRFAPALFAQYEFRDAMDNEARFAANAGSGDQDRAHNVREKLMDKADELGLPIDRGDIVVDARGNRIAIRVTYELSVEWLPGKEYTWTVREVTENRLF
jgi:hypothetical protein